MNWKNLVSGKISIALLITTAMLLAGIGFLLNSGKSRVEATTWPTSWNFLDDDPNDCNQNQRDVLNTYYYLDSNYLFLRMNTESNPNVNDTIYKWFLDSGNDAYSSGASIFNYEYLIVAYNGNMYKCNPTNDKLDNCTIIIDTNKLDYRIDGQNIDMKISLADYGPVKSVWWITDNNTNNLNQQPNGNNADWPSLGPGNIPFIRVPYCGDGTQDAGEECDDGNNVSGDGCSAICTNEVCTPGETASCDTGEQGVCAVGTKTCNEIGTWGNCIRNTNPSTEICDNLDNDCDGEKDEDNVCLTTYYCDTDNDTYISATSSGSCNTYNCVPTGCATSTGNDCNDANGNIHPGATEICNGVDDDCDGSTDEGFNVGQSCTVGQGVCQATGQYVCTQGGSGTECNAVPGTPDYEDCDNELDDDCDGLTDGDDSDCQGTICGYKFEDINFDLNWNTSTESGLENWTILLLKVLGSENTELVTTTITSEDGSYCFYNLPVGTYKVDEYKPSDWTCTRNDGSVPIEVTPGSIISQILIGNHRLGVCGDGVKELDEQCDDGSQNGQVCQAPYGGSCQYCSNSCQLVTVQGPYCGDGTKNGSEACDGTDGVGEHQVCSDECTLIDLPYCGNGIIDEDEQCDGDNLGGKTCESLDYYGGTLSCNASCQFDTSQCTTYIPPTPQCSDGVDNDDDGFIDYPNDPGCTSPEDDDEYNAPEQPPEQPPTGGGGTINEYTLYVTKEGIGLVTSGPAGIDCGGVCQYNFAKNSEVTLTATPQAGSVFVGWSGDCSGTESTCTVKMDRTRSVKAIFRGQVLGEATTTCGIYLFDYIKYGAPNNPEEVKKLQRFLNQEMGANLAITGIYDWITMEWVNKFQLKYKEEILKPWVEAGVHPSEDIPTGYVYKTTKRWINMLMCPQLNLLMPDLSEDVIKLKGYLTTTEVTPQVGGAATSAEEEISPAKEEIPSPPVTQESPQPSENLSAEANVSEVAKKNNLWIFILIVLIILGIVGVIYDRRKKKK